jgi:hypothetical protein
MHIVIFIFDKIYINNCYYVLLFFFGRHGTADIMAPVEERGEVGGYYGGGGGPWATLGGPWAPLGPAYKPSHASRQLLVEEGMLLFSPTTLVQEGEEGPKPFKSLISNIDYFVGK